MAVWFTYMPPRTQSCLPATAFCAIPIRTFPTYPHHTLHALHCTYPPLHLPTFGILLILPCPHSCTCPLPCPHSWIAGHMPHVLPVSGSVPSAWLLLSCNMGSAISTPLSRAFPPTLPFTAHTLPAATASLPLSPLMPHYLPPPLFPHLSYSPTASPHTTALSSPVPFLPPPTLLPSTQPPSPGAGGHGRAGYGQEQSTRTTYLTLLTRLPRLPGTLPTTRTHPSHLHTHTHTCLCTTAHLPTTLHTAHLPHLPPPACLRCIRHTPCTLLPPSQLFSLHCHCTFWFSHARLFHSLESCTTLPAVPFYLLKGLLLPLPLED